MTPCAICRNTVSLSEAIATTRAQGDLFDSEPPLCLVCAERVAFAAVAYASGRLRALIDSLAREDGPDAVRWRSLSQAVQRVDELDERKRAYCASESIEARHA